MASTMMEALMELCQEKHIDQLYLLDRLEESLAESYAKITLVDLRYLPSYLLGDYVDFHGQDVLFLYSSLLLNNSLALR